MPNLELMEFIGREEEVAYIDNLIKKAHIHTMLFLCGAGGLGKTRLLQEIRNAYESKSEFLATQIIDFDDRSLRTFEGSEIRIAQELGIVGEVAKEIHDLRRFRSAGAIKGILEAQAQVITNILKSQFNHLSKNKRILFFFDTVEKVEESHFRSLLSLLSNFENGVFLFAGRPSAENPQAQVDISQLMKNQFGEDAYVIDVKPLNEAKSGEYLRTKLRTLHNIRGEWIQNLLTLVKGRPILIELTAEWLSIVPQPDWLLKELHSLIDEDLKKKQEDFAANLVRHITHLRTPMDRLLLVLSRIYPFDVEMAEELLGLSREDAEMLVESAKKYVFVKTLPGAKITLHDEMRKMVNELVWPFVDNRDERKRRDSRRAAALFERRLDSVANNQQNEENVFRSTQYEEQQRIEQETLIEQWLEHALSADGASGYDVLTKNWNRAVVSKDYDFAERILEIAKPFSDQFTIDHQLDYDLLTARLHNYTRYDEDSIKSLRKWIVRYAKEPSNLSAIYNALGIAEQKYGNLKDAASYLSKNLEIIKGTNPSRVPYVINQLGYTYRLMGDLEKAENTYKDALVLAMEVARHDRDLIASLLNNLGYIYGIQKKYDIAENYCSQAADIWNDTGLPSQLARVDISLGIFYRDRGNYEEAIKLLDQARGRVSGSGDYELIGRAHFHFAWAKWFKWEEINKTAILDWDEIKKKDDFIDIDLLIEAKGDFDYCLDIAQVGAPRLLPGILHQMSNVYWWLGWLKDEQYKSKARELNTRAYEESERRKNIRYAIDSLVGDAEFDYDAGEYSKIPEYARKLEAMYGRKEKEYSLYFGRIIKILGDVAFSRGQYNEALMYYTNALPKIQRHGGFGKYSTRLELLRLERKLDKLQVSEVNMWLEYFQDHWKKRVELIHWCEKERLRVKLRVN